MSSKHFETFFSSKHTPSKNQHMEPTKSPVWKKEHDLPFHLQGIMFQPLIFRTVFVWLYPGIQEAQMWNEFLLGLGTLTNTQTSGQELVISIGKMSHLLLICSTLSTSQFYVWQKSLVTLAIQPSPNKKQLLFGWSRFGITVVVALCGEGLLISMSKFINNEDAYHYKRDKHMCDIKIVKLYPWKDAYSYQTDVKIHMIYWAKLMLSFLKKTFSELQ